MKERTPEIMVAESTRPAMTRTTTNGSAAYGQRILEELDNAGAAASWEDPTFIKEVDEILTLPSGEREKAFVRFALGRGK